MASWQTVVFNTLIKPTVEANNEIRCLQSSRTDTLIETLLPSLISADIAIIDVTDGGDDLSYYLLGIRNACKNGTILISKDATHIIANKFRARYVISYATETEDDMERFKKDLRHTITQIRQKPVSDDNPVQSQLKRTEKETVNEELYALREENHKMQITIETLHNKISTFGEVLSSMQYSPSDHTHRGQRAAEKIKFTRVETSTQVDAPGESK